MNNQIHLISKRHRDFVSFPCELPNILCNFDQNQQVGIRLHVNTTCSFRVLIFKNFSASVQ